MSERIRLKVLGISYSQIQTGAYALILAQAGGPYRIPVVIGAAEAQSIALCLENITPPRPMTHDLFVCFAHAFGVNLVDVYIYRFENGVFASELTFSDGERTIKIDSRTSDAIAIALRTGTPIYTTSDILNETGFIMETQNDDSDGDDYDEDEEAAAGAPEFKADDDDNEISSSSSLFNQHPRPENYTIEELERTLARLIEQENYEEAAKINDILKQKRNNP